MTDDMMKVFPLEVFDRKTHLQQWARAVFSEKLKKAGFISYQNEDLSWYKVINGEVLLTVYLHTFSPVNPLVPAIGYGMHPLFIESPLPQKVSVRGWVDNEVMARIYFNTPKIQFDESTYVLCPNTPLRGAEKLDEVLFPLFSSVHTIRDAYLVYKSRYLEYAQTTPKSYDWRVRDILLTNDFIDMAIYLDDKEMYPICLHSLEEKIGWKKEEKRTQAQIQAIKFGNRNAYLEELDSRRLKLSRKLEDKLDIKISL